VESLTIPISEDNAKRICIQVQKFYEEKRVVSWKCLCHFCDGNGFKDGKNNRGCSLINHIFDKLS
jgi:hypothetical protein